jgi:hypothetical protein
MPIISALGRLRQEDHELEANLDRLHSETCLKKQMNNNKKTQNLTLSSYVTFSIYDIYSATPNFNFPHLVSENSTFSPPIIEIFWKLSEMVLKKRFMNSNVLCTCEPPPLCRLHLSSVYLDLISQGSLLQGCFHALSLTPFHKRRSISFQHLKSPSLVWVKIHFLGKYLYTVSSLFCHVPEIKSKFQGE